jgi:hypothetical protein
MKTITYEHTSTYRKVYECWELVNDGVSVKRTFKKSFSGRTTEEALEQSRQYAKSERDKQEEQTDG